MEYSNKESIAIKLYRMENWCYKHKMRIAATVIYHLMQIILGCTIPYSADIEEGVNIAHFHGIVIHQKSRVGGYTAISKLLSGWQEWQGRPSYWEELYNWRRSLYLRRNCNRG